MALTEITHRCGHHDTVQILGTNIHGERDREAARYGTIDCPDCRKAKAAAWCADRGCAPLTGSTKQIAWAETIRRDVIAGIEHARTLMDKAPAEAIAQADAIIDEQKRRTDASWWIDHRDDPRLVEAAQYSRQH